MTYYCIERTDKRSEPQSKAWRLVGRRAVWTHRDTMWVYILIIIFFSSTFIAIYLILIKDIGGIWSWHENRPSFMQRALTGLLVGPFLTTLITTCMVSLALFSQEKIFHQPFPETKEIAESDDLSELEQMKINLEKKRDDGSATRPTSSG